MDAVTGHTGCDRRETHARCCPCIDLNQCAGRHLPSNWPVFERLDAQCHSVSMQAIAGLEHAATPWLILQMLHPSSNCWQVGFSRIFSVSVPPAEAVPAKNIETIIATNDACVRAVINSPGKDIGSSQCRILPKADNPNPFMIPAFPGQHAWPFQRCGRTSASGGASSRP